MKKLLAALVCCGMCVALLVSCDSFKHEHIIGEWRYDENAHWRIVTCTWGKCDFNIKQEPHVNEDENNVCDVCGYVMSETKP